MWFKRRKLKKITNRIFLSQGHLDVFQRRMAISRTEFYVMWICGLKTAFNDENRGEIQRRQEYLRREGLKAPKNLNQCDQLIKDLRTWREM